MVDMREGPDILRTHTASLRKGMKWILGESPVAARAIEILYQKIKVDKEKLLVVAGTPWLQM